MLAISRSASGAVLFVASVFLGLWLSAASSGCMVGPNYVRPVVPTATTWIEAQAAAVRTEPSVPTRWWEVFSDPVLSRLVKVADTQNLTVQTAGMRVIEAQARRAVTIGNLFPQQQALTASYARNVVSENAYGAAPGILARNYSSWQAGFDTAWELDLWGKFRRAVEAADADLLAASASYGDVLVTLVAEIASIIAWMVNRPRTMMLAFVALIAVTGLGYAALPTGFLPVEDQGYVIAGVQLPDAAAQPRTAAVVERVNDIIRHLPGVADWVSIGGNSVLDGTTAANAATFYIIFKPWEERTDPSLSQSAIIADLRHRLSAIPEANTFVFPPPSIRGLGVAGGFQMQLEDRGGAGLAALQDMVQEIVHDGGTQTGIGTVNSTFRAGVPQIFVDADRVKAKTLGVPLTTLFGTLQAYLGSVDVNDFNLFGRTYQVRVQAEPGFRTDVGDIARLEVRDTRGAMIPLGTLADVRDSIGPQIVPRYNLYPAAGITGEAAAGYSSGQALSLMEQMAIAKLPPTIGYDWTAISYQEKRVGNEAWLLFALAVMLVYLVLAAQYESWSNPAAVVLVVPLAVLGTVIAVAVRGMDNNVYTQIGVVLLIALASKNAILIVEFARDYRARGNGIREAAVEAARLRFRPILMTSFAFILGVYPLVIASGAGGASRQALGTAVFGGMLTSTFLALLFVPVFYVVCQEFSERRGSTKNRPTHPR